ncbi:MAG: hypothetical protein AAF228_13330 [Pseudomonadota bacterium]
MGLVEIPRLRDKIIFLREGLPKSLGPDLPQEYPEYKTQEAFANSFHTTTSSLSHAIGGVKDGEGCIREGGKIQFLLECAIAYRYGFGMPPAFAQMHKLSIEDQKAWLRWYEKHWPEWRADNTDFEECYKQKVRSGEITWPSTQQPPLNLFLEQLHDLRENRKKKKKNDSVKSNTDCSISSSSLVSAAVTKVQKIIKFDLSSGQRSIDGEVHKRHIIVDFSANRMRFEVEECIYDISLKMCQLDLKLTNCRVAIKGRRGFNQEYACPDNNISIKWTGTGSEPSWDIIGNNDDLNGSFVESFCLIEGHENTSVIGNITAKPFDFSVTSSGTKTSSGNRQKVLERLAAMAGTNSDKETFLIAVHQL